MKRVMTVLVLVLTCPVLAQESASYKVTEHTFSAGGHPVDGTPLTSANFKATLGAIGDSVVGGDLTSTSYCMDGGFIPGYPPPGEVHELYFTDIDTLVWSPEKSVGHYNLYRGSMDDISGFEFGGCEQHDVASNTATDGDEPDPSGGFFYLITAENRLQEEGIKGFRSDGAEREGVTCP